MANKPLNKAKAACVTTTSNCVIWQGPDLPCIDLCTGDTISEVVYKLACKLCDVITSTTVSEYDLSCLDLTKCDLPSSFIEMIQLLIDTICELKTQISGDETPTTSGCPDCEIVVASCFQAEGGSIQQMKDYIEAIGQKICEQEITIINQQNAIEQLLARVEALES